MRPQSLGCIKGFTMMFHAMVGAEAAHGSAFVPLPRLHHAPTHERSFPTARFSVSPELAGTTAPPVVGTDSPRAVVPEETNGRSGDDDIDPKQLTKLEGRLAKQLREASLKYRMVEDGDHIMVCVSGGKDSATMLHLLLQLQRRLAPAGTRFDITAVHLDQKQPGYDGMSLVRWLDGLGVSYRIVEEDTYTIVKEKTPENKTHCSMCSRLRRGILYSVANDIGANKLALGHHGDDAVETLLLNLIHAGQTKSMPARYYAERGVHVIRPLIYSLERDIRTFAQGKNFPILPCNLCGSQPDAQRAKMKLLCDTLEMLNPNARRNIINAMGDVRPSHLLDVGLREACGFDSVTGRVKNADRGNVAREASDGESRVRASSDEDIPSSFIERLL